jgi:hypothetical protein
MRILACSSIRARIVRDAEQFGELRARPPEINEALCDVPEDQPTVDVIAAESRCRQRIGPKIILPCLAAILTTRQTSHIDAQHLSAAGTTQT